jgi:hypothetical protein
MAMYIFVPPFREATFRDVASCVFDKLRCAAGEKKKVEEHYFNGLLEKVKWIKKAKNKNRRKETLLLLNNNISSVFM